MKDRDKYTNKDLNNVTYILLSIRTDICPIEYYKDIIKYYGDVVRAFNKYSSDDQKKLSFESVNRWFDGSDGLIVKSSGSRDLGKAYNVNVYLDYFIIG